MVSNLTDMSEILDNIFDQDMATAYKQAQKVALSSVDLMFVNGMKCKFIEIFTQVGDYLDELDDVDDDFVWKNIQENLFPLCSKVAGLIEVMMKADPQTDEEAFRMMGDVFEVYGGFISTLIGFKKPLPQWVG